MGGDSHRPCDRDPEFLHYIDPKGSWPDLQSLVEVEATRRQGDQDTATTRYFIFSYPPQTAPPLAPTWDYLGIENRRLKAGRNLAYMEKILLT